MKLNRGPQDEPSPNVTGVLVGRGALTRTAEEGRRREGTVFDAETHGERPGTGLAEPTP